MRVSTSQIYDSGLRGLSKNQFDLYRLQNQLSTGRKVLTPQDDPIAASQTLVLSQSKGVSEQHIKNQETAQGKLGLVEGQLIALGNLLQDVRERLVQAGNTTLTNADRGFIAKELESRLSEMMGIANSQDGVGNYLFSGYQGATLPFAANENGASYYGDEGVRLLQVSHSRQIPVSLSGSEIFQKIRAGNGEFTTATGGNYRIDADGNFETDINGDLIKDGINRGTGIIDQGSIANLGGWSSAVNSGYGNLEIRFSTDSEGKSQYQIFAMPDATGLVTTPTAMTDPLPFVPGQAIRLQQTLDPLDPLTPMDPPNDFGASVVITGKPEAGDSFAIAPSTNQSMFTTLKNTIDMLRKGIGSVESGNSVTEYVNALAGNLKNIDQALENSVRMRATVGTHLKELDALNSAGQDMQLQYDTSISALQDLDYAEAITDMSKKKLQLEAAQLSFKQISQLSLFNIL